LRLVRAEGLRGKSHYIDRKRAGGSARDGKGPNGDPPGGFLSCSYGPRI